MEINPINLKRVKDLLVRANGVISGSVLGFILGKEPAPGAEKTINRLVDDLRAMTNELATHIAEEKIPVNDGSQLDLLSLTAHTSMSEYDRCVSDLAKYLPDGFIAQWQQGCTKFYTTKPKLKEPDGPWAGFWEGERAPHLDGLNVPETEAWRTSPRCIRSGSVVKGGEDA